MTPRWARASRRLYRLFLLVFPAEFRAEHGEPMTLMFGDLSRDAARRRGLPGLMGLWCRTLVDLVVNGIGERWRRLTSLRRRRPTRRRRRVFEDVARDVAFAVRTARKQPGLLVAAAVTLGTGIGANVSIFTFVNGVLLQPLPLANSQQLMMVTAVRPDGRPGGLGYYDVNVVSSDVNAFSAFGGYSASPWDLTGVAEPDRVEVATVTAGFFTVLQWTPAIGRLWVGIEEGPSQPRVVVLTDASWRLRFAGDPNIIGQTVSLDDTQHTVIGVLRAGAGAFPDPAVEFYVPPRENFGVGAFWMRGVARSQSDVTIAQARAGLDVVAQRLEAEHPDVYESRRFAVQPLHEAMVADARPALLMLLASVLLVLVVAVANVANLVLTRAIGRMREFAIRTALGANKRRLAQQVVIEGLLLGAVGGSIGLVAAFWTSKGLLALGPASLPRREDIVFDPYVAMFAFGLTLLVGAAVGTVSAVRISTSGTTDALRDGGTTSGPSTRRGWRHALMVVQVAVAFVLLAGAGLLLKSFWTLSRVDPGFTADNILSFRISLPRSRFPDRASITRFHEEVRSQLHRVADVDGLASVSLSPFAAGNLCNSLTGSDGSGVAAECVEFRSASGDYFELLGVRLLRGRLFNASDDASAPPRAIINQRLADLVWPGQDPVGRQFTMWDEYPNTEVIGVVSNVRQFGLDREPVPEVVMPQAQSPFRYAQYLVRTRTDAVSIVPRLREAVWQVSPAVPISNVTTMATLIDNSIDEPRFRAVILTGFAAVALIVSLAGVVAVVAYNVRVETRDIGVRIALGASRTRVVSGMLANHGRLVALGLVMGIASALMGLRVLRGFLFGVTPFDLAVMVGAIVLLGALGMLACYVPVRQASRVDPMVTLRS